MGVTQPRASAGGGMPSSPAPLFSDGLALNEMQKGQDGSISEHNPASSGGDPAMPLFYPASYHDDNNEGGSADYPNDYNPDNREGYVAMSGASGNGEPDGRVGVGTIHGALGIYEGQAVQNGSAGDFPFVNPQSTYSNSDATFGGDVDSGGDSTWKNM